MIRPLTMSQPVYFKAKTIDGGSPRKTKHFEEIQNNAEDLRQKSIKDKVQSAFLIGTAVGSIISATGAALYNNHEMESMLNEMAAEVAYDSVDSLGVKDLTKDEFPDIILYGKDGASTVYDMKNNNVFVNMDDELIEVDR